MQRSLTVADLRQRALWRYRRKSIYRLLLILTTIAILGIGGRFFVVQVMAALKEYAQYVNY